MKKRNYPAKLLLFGEYTIIKGSKALAIPYPLYSGRWAYALDAEGLAQKQGPLRELFTYLEELQLQGDLLIKYDLAAFREALQQGLIFESDIPAGYGVGSSGALSAAVFDAFAVNPPEAPATIRKMLAEIERFFHGSSSGTDPLVCLLEQPLLLEGGSRFQVVSLPERQPEENGSLFLIDTGISRETGPFVQLFLDKCERSDFTQPLTEAFIPLVNDLIDVFLGKEAGEKASLFRQLSQWQLDYFPEMIPETCREIWESGLKTGVFSLKLCGAGGGGFLLGYTEDVPAASQALEAWHFRLI